MAKATFVHSGDAIDYTPTVNVPAGTIIKHGYWVGVAKQAIPANTRGSLAIAGVFDFPKAATDFAVGVDVYWSEPNGFAFPGQFDPGDVFVGHAVEAASEPAPTVRVRLQHAPNSHSPQ